MLQSIINSIIGFCWKVCILFAYFVPVIIVAVILIRIIAAIYYAVKRIKRNRSKTLK